MKTVYGKVVDFGRCGWGLALLFLLVPVAGCGQVVPKQDPEAIVRERAQAYLSAMEQDDYRTAYGYLSPGFRLKVPYEGYAARYLKRIDWLSGEVKAVACAGEACKVDIRQGLRMLHAPFPGFEAFDDSVQTITQSWIFIEGQWWYRPSS